MSRDAILPRGESGGQRDKEEADSLPSAGRLVAWLLGMTVGAGARPKDANARKVCRYKGKAASSRRTPKRADPSVMLKQIC